MENYEAVGRRMGRPTHGKLLELSKCKYDTAQTKPRQRDLVVTVCLSLGLSDFIIS